MIYRDKYGCFAYRATMDENVVTNALDEFSHGTERVISAQGTFFRDIPRYLCIRFMAEGFPLAETRYSYEGRKEYKSAVVSLIANMAEQGFEIEHRERGTLVSPDKQKISFIHTETKKAAEKKRKTTLLGSLSPGMCDSERFPREGDRTITEMSAKRRGFPSTTRCSMRMVLT